MDATLDELYVDFWTPLMDPLAPGQDLARPFHMSYILGQVCKALRKLARELIDGLPAKLSLPGLELEAFGVYPDPDASVFGALDSCYLFGHHPEEKPEYARRLWLRLLSKEVVRFHFIREFASGPDDDAIVAGSWALHRYQLSVRGKKGTEWAPADCDVFVRFRGAAEYSAIIDRMNDWWERLYTSRPFLEHKPPPEVNELDASDAEEDDYANDTLIALSDGTTATSNRQYDEIATYLDGKWRVYYQQHLYTSEAAEEAQDKDFVRGPLCGIDLHKGLDIGEYKYLMRALGQVMPWVVRWLQFRKGGVPDPHSWRFAPHCPLSTVAMGKPGDDTPTHVSPSEYTEPALTKITKITKTRNPKQPWSEVHRFKDRLIKEHFHGIAPALDRWGYTFEASRMYRHGPLPDNATSDPVELERATRNLTAFRRIYRQGMEAYASMVVRRESDWPTAINLIPQAPASPHLPMTTLVDQFDIVNAQVHCRVQGDRYVFGGAGTALVDAHSNGSDIPLRLSRYGFGSGRVANQIRRLVKYRARGYMTREPRPHTRQATLNAQLPTHLR